MNAETAKAISAKYYKHGTNWNYTMVLRHIDLAVYSGESKVSVNVNLKKSVIDILLKNGYKISEFWVGNNCTTSISWK